jgi:hypothetical protein
VGRYDHAEALLQQALEDSASVVLPEGLDEDLESAAYGCPCSWPLRAAVMETVWPAGLEKPTEMEVLFPEDRAGADWLRLLIRWGAELRMSATELPRERLPLVCVAQCHRSSVELACISDGGLLARTDELTETPSQYDPETQYVAFELQPGAQALWTDPTAQPAGAWKVTLELEGTEVASVELQDGIALNSTAPSDPPPAPDAPIIAIWL